MRVDPATGQAIYDEANTVGGQVGIDALASTGADIPLAYDLLSALPSATHTMAWNMNRVSKTMLSGGRISAQDARGIRQTFSPGAFRRLARVENIDAPDTKYYSPFNFLAPYANKAANSLARRASSENAGMMTKSLMKRLTVFGEAGEGEEYFSRGVFGRMAAISKVNSASDASFAKMKQNIFNSTRAMNPNAMFDRVSKSPGYGKLYDAYLKLDPIGTMTKDDATRAMILSIRGRYAQGAVSYMQASEKFAQGRTATSIVDGWAEKTAARAGAEKFAAHVGSSSRALQFAAKNARFGLVAARVAGPVGTILLARDLAVMGGKVLKNVAETTIDAARSVKGSIDKPIMGMGYKDNMVAATSRQRGVAAISNSRLNMRSVLGSEAAGIHAAWG